MHILIFFYAPGSWGPKKLSYPYKGARNVLHSCEQMPRMSQMPTFRGDPLGSNSRRTMEEQSSTHGHLSQINPYTFVITQAKEKSIRNSAEEAPVCWWGLVAARAVTDSRSYPTLQGGIHPAPQTRNLLLGLCSLSMNAATLWWIKIILENELTCVHQMHSHLLSSHLSQAKHDKTKY